MRCHYYSRTQSHTITYIHTLIYYFKSKTNHNIHMYVCVSVCFYLHTLTQPTHAYICTTCTSINSNECMTDKNNFS